MRRPEEALRVRPMELVGMGLGGGGLFIEYLFMVAVWWGRQLLSGAALCH